MCPARTQRKDAPAHSRCPVGTGLGNGPIEPSSFSKNSVPMDTGASAPGEGTVSQELLTGTGRAHVPGPLKRMARASPCTSLRVRKCHAPELLPRDTHSASNSHPGKGRSGVSCWLRPPVPLGWVLPRRDVWAGNREVASDTGVWLHGDRGGEATAVPCRGKKGGASPSMRANPGVRVTPAALGT